MESREIYLLRLYLSLLILLPTNKCEMQKEELEQMVRDVNDNHVDEEEILSYRVYLYDRQHDCIE